MMRGHVMFEWQMNPARLAIWTLRVIRVGRHECPGLHSVLSEHLREDAGQAIQATQVLSFVVQNSALPAQSKQEAFSPELEDDEKLLVAALAAISKLDLAGATNIVSKLGGAHTAIIMGTLTDLAAIYARRGLSFADEQAQMPASKAETSVRPTDMKH